MRSYHALFSYRATIVHLVLRHLRIRYRGSILGFLWAFLHPLLTMLVLFVVFTQIVKIQIQQYPLFLLSGLLPWIFFSNSLIDASRSILENANLVKKVYFPREILPVSYVLSNFINLLFGLTAFLLILIIFRMQGLRFIYFLPIILIVHLVFTLGLALFLSCANVYFRDISHILGIVLMFWFYLTPILYPLSMVPQKFYNVYFMNPMALIVVSYRNILFEGRLPLAMNIVVGCLAAMVMLLFGYFVFTKYSPSLVKKI